MRSREKLERALATLDRPLNEVHEGDVIDRNAVTATIDGCDAVVHTANVYTYDPRRESATTPDWLLMAGGVPGI